MTRRYRRRPLHVDTRPVVCIACGRRWRMLVPAREVARAWRGVGRVVCGGCAVTGGVVPRDGG